MILHIIDCVISIALTITAFINLRFARKNLKTAKDNIRNAELNQRNAVLNSEIARRNDEVTSAVLRGDTTEACCKLDELAKFVQNRRALQ